MHGSSPAAWTAVLLALVGIAIGGISLIPEPSWIIFTIGIVLALVAGPTGFVMAKLGYGVDKH